MACWRLVLFMWISLGVIFPRVTVAQDPDTERAVREAVEWARAYYEAEERLEGGKRSTFANVGLLISTPILLIKRADARRNGQIARANFLTNGALLITAVGAIGLIGSISDWTGGASDKAELERERPASLKLGLSVTPVSVAVSVRW